MKMDVLSNEKVNVTVIDFDTFFSKQGGNLFDMLHHQMMKLLYHSQLKNTFSFNPCAITFIFIGIKNVSYSRQLVRLKIKHFTCISLSTADECSVGKSTGDLCRSHLGHPSAVRSVASLYNENATVTPCASDSPWSLADRSSAQSLVRVPRPTQLQGVSLPT